MSIGSDGKGPPPPPGRPPTGGGVPRMRPVTGGGSAIVGAPVRPPTGGVDVSAAQRRLNRRAAYVAPARVVVGARHFDGRAENIGEGGMMLNVPEGLRDRESVSARFALPMSQQMVSVPATVAWRKPTRPGHELVGLEFALVDETLRREIEKFVAMMLGPA
jgi:hypothetical protein